MRNNHQPGCVMKSGAKTVNRLSRTTRACRLLAAAVALPAGLAGCKHTIAVEPIEVKPIHLTLDINLKVDRELDEFFEFEDEVVGPTTTAPAATAPGSRPPAANLQEGTR